MKTKRFDKFWFGFGLGLVSPLVGFLAYGVFWSYYFQKTFSYFANDIFLGVRTFQSSIVTLSLLMMLVPFFAMIRTDRYRGARGVLAALFVYVPIVVYLRFS